MIPDIDQSTGILFGMACAIIALVCVLAYVLDDLIRTKADLLHDAVSLESDIRFTLVHEMGKMMVAERLREIARNYDSPESVMLRQKIGRTTWKEGGTPLPALWLLAVADEISPEPSVETSTEYTLDGTAHTYEHRGTS